MTSQLHNFDPSSIFIKKNFLTDDVTYKDETDDKETVVIETANGRTVLVYDGFRYTKAYRTKNGTRWNCELRKYCSNFISVSSEDEIVLSSVQHTHQRPRSRDLRLKDVKPKNDDRSRVITSRKGKEMLLYKQFTYRKQYDTGEKIRWTCSTQKNCRAAIFTDLSADIISSNEEHNHNPPKYYLDPTHVLDALSGTSDADD